ncbi:MAG: nitrate reductase NapE component [Zhongshania sp.]|jgi:nitrate reductase NapE component
MAKSAIDALRASQVTAREKLAFGSNSFPLYPLLAVVLSGAEGMLA